MIEAHLKKLRVRDNIGSEEEAAIRAMISEVRDFPADRVIIRRGQELKESLLLLDGWIARTKDLREGGRQISELQFAGLDYPRLENIPDNWKPYIPSAA